MPDPIVPAIGLTPEERHTLTGLRNSLLTLHKLLIDTERMDYEREHGRIGSPGEFLTLLMTDSWFSWLGPLTGLIVRIDEGLAATELMTADDAKAFANATRALLVPSEAGVGFSKRYDEALQRDPSIVFAHREVMRHLTGKS